jgi:TPR repeat protein
MKALAVRARFGRLLRTPVICAVLVLLSVLPQARGEESSYNLGVEAWRAQDFAQARKHWRRSVLQGGPDQAFNKCHCCASERPLAYPRRNFSSAMHTKTGGGVEKNPVRAYAWYVRQRNRSQTQRARQGRERARDT